MPSHPAAIITYSCLLTDFLRYKLSVSEAKATQGTCGFQSLHNNLTKYLKTVGLGDALLLPVQSLRGEMATCYSTTGQGILTDHQAAIQKRRSSCSRKGFLTSIEGGTIALLVVAGILVLGSVVSMCDTEFREGVEAVPRNFYRESARTDVKKWYNDRLDKIVAARLREESRLGPGAPIFLAHSTGHGLFRHCAVHVHGYKYELRPGERGLSDTQRHYTAVTTYSCFNFEVYKQSMIRNEYPEPGICFYSIAGWTTLPKEEIDGNSHRITETLVNQGCLSATRHNFVWRFVHQIATTKAPYWDWIRRNKLADYLYIQLPALHSDAISVATWAAYLHQMKHSLDPVERQRIETLISVAEGFVDVHIVHSMAVAGIPDRIRGPPDCLIDWGFVEGGHCHAGGHYDGGVGGDG